MPNELAMLFPILWLGSAGVAHSAIYSFTDSTGTVHYSNVPVDERFAPLPGTEDLSQTPRQESSSLAKAATYSQLIEGAARDNRLEPALVAAVMVVESGGDPKAVSRRGAQGLMQLMPETARKYGVNDVFDPAQNIRGGARYLHDLAQRYQNDLELILAAYNAGPEAVDRQGRQIPQLHETLAYVPRVIQLYRKLTALTAAR
ncbi:MAG TPA: lytic transglycosylase domain-containing protein [Steroidobacteraceae bacterium]